VLLFFPSAGESVGFVVAAAAEGLEFCSVCVHGAEGRVRDEREMKGAGGEERAHMCRRREKEAPSSE